MGPLTTERLVLEPWDERRRREWRRLCRDPAMMRYIERGVTWSRAEADAAFDEVLEHWRAHGFGWRSPLDRATGEWLGFAALNYVGPGTDGVAEDEVEIGWSIVRRAWGRGYAREAGAAMRDEAFERVGLERVVARLQPANVASARVALSLGMRLEHETTGRHGEAVHIYALARGCGS